MIIASGGENFITFFGDRQMKWPITLGKKKNKKKNHQNMHPQLINVNLQANMSI
jgi:hypothetical protein